jgi:hypothetical protein
LPRGTKEPASSLPGARGRSEIHPGSASDKNSRQTDLNHDAKLTPDELPAALFDRLDADKNGFVSEAEMAALWRR